MGASGDGRVRPVLVKLDPKLDKAVRVDGVWISPGEVAYVRASEAAKLKKAGKTA